MDRITNTTAEKAHSILIALCSDDASLRNRATLYLDQMDVLDAAFTSTSSNLRGTKRKAESAIKICVQCQEPFYEEDNADKACRYHEGALDPDDDGDFWADHEEEIHGQINTCEMKMEFPEGFRWSCCDKLGFRSGCTRGRHTTTGRHRGRYGTESGTGDTDGLGTTDEEDTSSDDSEISNGESEDDE